MAALVGLRQENRFEAQAAMMLEYAVDETVTDAYPLSMTQNPIPNTPSQVLDWGPLLEALLADLRRGMPEGVMAARFHNALVEGMVAVAQAVGAKRAALSGGCFQNRLLTERALDGLRTAGHRVLLHRQVPPGDGGISLGQVAVAASRLQDPHATLKMG